ncbi:uncharacterized protein EI90DRAFT_3054547 [Cantharellus anzutake]|uniref:uncharacterized protein n=1 Tax=Cantharellus anzutake TaxID=1750568 RepID=UPI001903B1CF|nr:uncharacterized protein EI90DRAFT_3054547 [Cantharellus anzutake]KAF8332819.1 hypothetical protein EI90DRAFT_3054547 [Cantharellus anzutake]
MFLAVTQMSSSVLLQPAFLLPKRTAPREQRFGMGEDIDKIVILSDEAGDGDNCAYIGISQHGMAKRSLILSLLIACLGRTCASQGLIRHPLTTRSQFSTHSNDFDHCEPS